MAELGDYDATKPLRTKIEAENSGSTDITFQSRAAATSRRPSSSRPTPREALSAAVYLHLYRFSRALYYREAFDLATRGSPCCSSTRRDDAAGPRAGRPPGSVYAADAFRSLVRHDLVDLRRALDYLEGRDDIDDRIAVVGQEYGALSAGGLAAVDDRVDALALSAVPAEPSRYWAQEFVPQETFDSFSELLRDFDPVRLLGSFDGDVLIQNPRRDDEWPPANTSAWPMTRTAPRSSGTPTTDTTWPGGRHRPAGVARQKLTER